jgi:tRNA threonylcarbamoyl adenosine modification protein (Sua5/YciO/YrdC/YwlC family)
MSMLFDCSDPVQRERGLGAAMSAVRRCELVVLPTDTVYGIGADAFTPIAVDALLAAKGRGRDLPVPVLVSSSPMVTALAGELSPAGQRLIDTFWPGALTIVVRHTAGLVWDLGDTRGTVALRMPDHPVALSLIAETGPLAVSSANRTGEAPATTAAAAREQLAEDVGVYLDGGTCAGGVPSTIVDLTGDRPQVLRHGAIGVDRLTEVVGDLSGE